MTESASPAARPWLRPELLRSWGEFLLVAALLIAVPIRNSTLGALHGSSVRYLELILTNTNLLWTLVFESVALSIFLYYLHRRGWRPADLKIGIGWVTSAQGIVLLIAAWGGAIITLITLIYISYLRQSAYTDLNAYLMSMAPPTGTGEFHLTWIVLFIAMIVNAFTEEIVFMGFIFNQLAARRGIAVALPVTIFLRVACHTYQDPIHVAGIGVLFTVFAIWYCVGRRLWPLILAHLLLDTISGTLVPIMQHLRHQLGAALVYFGQAS